ncbi:MAG: hypothetical protein V4474_00615 [Patescibacteria group bacterium]
MKHLWIWFYSAVIITALCIGMYSVGQQVLRQSMNDVPVQLAEDGASKLDNGAVPAEVVPHGTPIIDIAKSLSPWLVIYDSAGKPLENTGQLDNWPPQMPLDTFNHLDFWRHGHSWQPSTGVRQDVAMVATKDGKYIVAAGHNMREMEMHVEHLGYLMLEGWIALMVFISGVQLAYVFGGKFARGDTR